MDNAFVAIVPTRPCPLFGRPVHRRDGSHRFPELLLMPFGFHLTVDTLPSLAMLARASGALPPPSDMVPSIWAPVGLQPT
jgi:hypothetical protein